MMDHVWTTHRGLDTVHGKEEDVTYCMTCGLEKEYDQGDKTPCNGGVMVTAKFKVDRVERAISWTGKEVRTVVMSPVHDNNPENKQFWEATPSGELKLGCANFDAAAEFDLGDEFYIDFRKAIKADPVTKG